MIKSISTLFLTLLFTFTQAMAYAPNQVQVHLSEKLESFEARNITFNSKMTESEFNKSQKKAIKGLKKELKKVRNKSDENQTKYALNKLSKRFKRLRTLTKLSLKNKRRVRKLAKSSGKTFQEVEAHYKNYFNSQKEEKVKKDLLKKIKIHGSYAKTLQEGISEVESMTYESLADLNTEKVLRKPAQVDTMVLIILLFYFVIPTVLLAALILFFVSGGIVGGVIVSAVLAGYLFFVLAI
ncbi:hypothetical protein N9N67_08635 [Bacteriovoracaceae bacterium]|nr:hypothetical protein [Bacteriovoracaceae bacterium]